MILKPMNIGSNENLGLMLQTAEGITVDNTVSVTLEGGAYRAGLLQPESTSRRPTLYRVGRKAFFFLFSYLANIKPTNH